MGKEPALGALVVFGDWKRACCGLTTVERATSLRTNSGMNVYILTTYLSVSYSTQALFRNVRKNVMFTIELVKHLVHHGGNIHL